MTATMQNTQQVGIAVMARDAAGNPTVLPAGITLSWSVDNTTLGSLTPAADTLSAVFTAAGPVGTATITAATSDGKLSATAQIDVVGGEAVSIELVVGTPTAKA